MNNITCLIVHYNRVKNIPGIIESIRKQTIPSTIIVWDNSGDCPVTGIDILIKSSFNYSNPRLAMSALIKTDYIWTQDDDCRIIDNNLFEKVIENCNKYPDAYFGWSGRYYGNEKINWDFAYQSPGWGWADFGDMKVDFVNMGIGFCKTDVLCNIPLNPFYCDKEMRLTEEEYRWADDMYISAQLKHKRITEFLRESVELIDECGQGLSKQTNHMIMRNRLAKKLWNPIDGIKKDEVIKHG